MIHPIQTRAPFQSKGRNGWFWPVAANLTAFERVDCVRIDIEGAKSVNGAQAPIQIALTRAEALRLAKAIIWEAREHCGACGVLQEREVSS